MSQRPSEIVVQFRREVELRLDYKALGDQPPQLLDNALPPSEDPK